MGSQAKNSHTTIVTERKRNKNYSQIRAIVEQDFVAWATKKKRKKDVYPSEMLQSW